MHAAPSDWLMCWKVSELQEVVRRRLDAIGFKNFAVVEGSHGGWCLCEVLRSWSQFGAPSLAVLLLQRL